MLNNLSKILKGELKTDDKTLKHYSSDGSIFSIKPQGVIFPKSWEDIFNLVKWLSDENKRGNRVSVTARGKGTDLTGAPLSESLIVRFPGYLDNILEIGDNFVRCEPGVIYADLQKKLAEQGKTIPVNPASANFCTAGGMVANNSGGTKSVKYGETRDYVKNLKVILANGEEIDTANYRNSEIEELINKNKDLIERHKPNVTKNASGYYLWDFNVGHPMSNIAGTNLTNLFVGSEGTLGIIKEITFKIEKMPTYDGVLLGYFNNLKDAGIAVTRLLKYKPSALEMVDKSVIDIVGKMEPELVVDLPKETPKIVLYAEFDGFSEQEVKEQIENVIGVMKELAFEYKSATEKEEKERLWKVRIKSASVIEHTKEHAKGIPFVEDGTVAPERFPEYIEGINSILSKYGIDYAVWGHAGNADLHVRPLIDLSNKRQKALVPQIANDFYTLIRQMNGTGSGEHGDGIARTPFLELIYGVKMVELFKDVKNIFDPQGIFNPLSKTGATLEHYQKYMRDNYEVYGG